MPYFPSEDEQRAGNTYVCRGCGGTFVRGHISCCVAHAPGTCCHFGETNALTNRPIGPVLTFQTVKR